MRYDLYGFQKNAMSGLIRTMQEMQDEWHKKGKKSSVALTAPTGAGKTVICAAVAEGLFNGNEMSKSDPNAIILWVSDNPSLNRQTKHRFAVAADNLNEDIGMILIDANFAKSYEKLERHKVYFLNRQKLSGNLGKSSEGSRTFWDVLRNTIEDPNLNLYFMIDEAHRGLGSGDNKSTSDAENKTIYAKLIDGQKGLNPAMPVVVGISATIERWNKAMGERNKNNDRVCKDTIVVSNEDVREAGIIKKIIELRAPKVFSDVKDQDLYMACHKLDEFADHWKQYCIKFNEKMVTPLMVVQVEDNVSDETLWKICRSIKFALPQLDVKTAFANVFGEHTNRGNEDFNIPYVSPDDVQENVDVRILFAKDAISTGWDCPRAEVLYSRRKRKDKTYIHQMFGRMIRTPLGHKIDSDDFLNKVVCYLPEYDTGSVAEVVELIRNDKDLGDITKISTGDIEACWYKDIKDIAVNVLNIVSDSVEKIRVDNKNDFSFGLFFENHAPEEKIKFIVNGANKNKTILPKGIDAVIKSGRLDSLKFTKIATELKEIIGNMPTTSFDTDKKLEECFENITSRFVEQKNKDVFVQFFNLVNFLVAVKYPGTDDSWENDESLKKEFCINIDSSISLNQDEFDKSFNGLFNREQSVTKVDILSDEKKAETVNESVKVIRSNLFNIGSNKLYKECCYRFNSDYVKAYFEYKMDKDKLTDEDVCNRLVAVIRCESVMAKLEEYIVGKIEYLVNKHNVNKFRLSEHDKVRWEQIVNETQNWGEYMLSVPLGSVLQKSDYSKYKKHLIVSADGYAYLKLNKLESFVVEKETVDNNFNIAWYRNPAHVCNSSLSIPYKVDDNEYKNFFPDFLFFEKTNDGKVICNIVDPHGDWLGDSIARLKGYIRYLKDYGDNFGKVLAVTEVERGKYRYLDLKNPSVVSAIESFNGSMARPLFDGNFSQEYK